MDAIERVLIAPIKDLLSKIPSLGPELSLAIAGVAAVLVFFLISLIFVAASSNKSFKKKLEGITVFINDGEVITEENVEGLHNRMETEMPDSINKGWSYFLEQRDGYPSDYITQRDVFEDKKPAKAGKVFFGITSAIVIILTIWVSFMMGRTGSLKDFTFSQIADKPLLLAGIIASLCAPLLAYIIFRAILGAACNKQLKKTKAAFADFQTALDEKIMIYAEPEDEFISDNMSEINAEIEEILANKLNNREIVEIITVPKIEETEPVDAEEPVEEEVIEEEVVEEEIVDEEPELEEVAAAVAVEEEASEEDEESMENLLIRLVYMVEEMSKDENLTANDIEQVVEILYTEMLRPDRDEVDRKIIEECFVYLAEIAPLYGMDV